MSKDTAVQGSGTTYMSGRMDSLRKKTSKEWAVHLVTPETATIFSQQNVTYTTLFLDTCDKHLICLSSWIYKINFVRGKY